MIYAITYDLISPGQKYTLLESAIKKEGEAYHALQNLWFLNTQLSVSHVSNALHDVVDSNDSIFITQLRKGEYHGWLATEDHNWLDARI